MTKERFTFTWTAFVPKSALYGQCKELARIDLSVMHLAGAQAPLGGFSGVPVTAGPAGLWDHYAWLSLQGSRAYIPSPKELQQDPGNATNPSR
ncbi:hypothetical protein MaudCBS49596_002516 [Microsporum audouinii]